METLKTNSHVFSKQHYKAKKVSTKAQSHQHGIIFHFILKKEWKMQCFLMFVPFVSRVPWIWIRRPQRSEPNPPSGWRDVGSLVRNVAQKREHCKTWNLDVSSSLDLGEVLDSCFAMLLGFFPGAVCVWGWTKKSLVDQFFSSRHGNATFCGSCLLHRKLKVLKYHQTYFFVVDERRMQSAGFLTTLFGVLAATLLLVDVLHPRILVVTSGLQSHVVDYY